jgi:hypothetical protein
MAGAAFIAFTSWVVYFGGYDFLNRLAGGPIPAYAHAVTAATIRNDDEFGAVSVTNDSFETVYKWYKDRLPGAQVSDLTALCPRAVSCSYNLPRVRFTVSNGLVEIASEGMQTEITILNKKPASHDT